MSRWIALSLLAPVLLHGQTLPCYQHPRNLSDCNAYGCAIPHTPEADANTVKNTPPSLKVRKILSISAFEELQSEMQTHCQQGLAVNNREIFHNIAIHENVRSKRLMLVGEGDRVAVAGYIVGAPHARRAESANCLLIGNDNNGFRINIAETPDDPPYASVVVEIIPRIRDSAWTLDVLRGFRDSRTKVRITGKLFYENKRILNSDPDEVMAEPQGISLWEIHPVTAIEYCAHDSGHPCEDGRDRNWVGLEGEK